LALEDLSFTPNPAQKINLSIEKRPFRRQKNQIEDYFSFNPSSN